MIVRETYEGAKLNTLKFGAFKLSNPYFTTLCEQLLVDCKGQKNAPTKWAEIPGEVLLAFANSSNAIEFLMVPESSGIQH